MNCPNCKSDIVEEIIKSQIEGNVCEISYMCKICGKIGYWAYPYQGDNMGYEIKPPNTRVYCINCKHFVIEDVVDGPDGMSFKQEICNAPNNFKDTYYAPKIVRIYPPKICNHNNRCEWFEMKVN